MGIKIGNYTVNNISHIPAIIDAFNGNAQYMSYCSSCQNNPDESYYESKLTPISADEFADKVIDHILGEGWQVTDPLSKEQILAIALDDIIKKVKKHK